MPRKNKNWGIVKPPLGFGVDWGDPISRGLVGCWLFNEGAGTKVYDLANRTTGTLTNGPTFVNGKLGKAINFDSTSDYVALGINKLGKILNGAPGVTVSAWVSPSAWPGAGARRRAVSIPITNSSAGIVVGFYSNVGRIDVAGRSVSTDSLQAAGIINFPALNEWHLITGVFNFPGDAISIYLDGIHQITTSVTFANSSYTNGTPTSLSETISSSGGGSEYFAGDISSVSIYKRVLSATEIMRLYTEPFAGILAPRREILYVSGSTPVTDIFDGKIIIKSSGTNLLDGKVMVKDVITALLDGKVMVKDVITTLLDGKVRLKDAVSLILDGKVTIKDIATAIFDGKLKIKDVLTALLDGKVRIKDIATLFLDGKIEISLGGIGVNSLDGKVRVKDSVTTTADGKVIIKISATDILDGKISIPETSVDLLDARIQVKSFTTVFVDGKLVVSGDIWIVRTPSGYTAWTRDVPTSEEAAYGRGTTWGNVVQMSPGIIIFSARFPLSSGSGSTGPTAWTKRENTTNTWDRRS